MNGSKRRILTDTSGMVVVAAVHAADIQDRDGPPSLLSSVRSAFRWLRHVFADGGYAREKLGRSLYHSARGRLRSSSGRLPRRWVERMLTWINRNRRVAKDSSSHT